MTVVVEINAPDHLLLSGNDKKVELDVGVSLRNVGDDDFIATVSNTNDVIFWHLLDANQREVARMPQAGKPTVSKDGFSVMEKRVPGGALVTFPETVEVDAKKLKHGATYILRVRAWGRSGEHEIKVVNVDQAPKAPETPTPNPAAEQRKKKAGKPAAKKPAAKKAAAKKPAAKPAAAKKPAAKKTKKAA
jgi:hypothetical protein